MSTNDGDALDRAIASALARDDGESAPQGFHAAVAARLYYAALLDRRRRATRMAAWLGTGSAILVIVVSGLFVSAVDIPGWVVDNVPGILGRLDGMRVVMVRSPGLVAAAAGAVLLIGAGILSAALRPRNN